MTWGVPRCGTKAIRPPGYEAPPLVRRRPNPGGPKVNPVYVARRSFFYSEDGPYAASP
jgi:hypothetical protein